MNKSTKPIAPELPPEFELTKLLDVDISNVIGPLMESRTEDPIVCPSTASMLRKMLPEALPSRGVGIDQVLDQIRPMLANYCRRNTHPGFFGYVASGGLPVDPLSHALVATVNQNVVGYPGSPSAATIERTVTQWLCELAGYPAQAEGVFLGGGSLANLTAMGAALVHQFGPDYRRTGIITAAAGKTPVIICSSATHFSIQRAAVLLGFGTDNVIAIDTDADHRMRLDLLERVLDEQDCVVCVVASAGTTTTGAIDPIHKIAELCERKQIWFHVDAAYGAGALLSESLRPLFDGIELADSITMDLHKWFFHALDCSVVLYRDPGYARQLFYEKSDYIHFPIDGPPEQHMFFHLGPELSRRFRALPALIAFCHYGAEAMGRNVLHNVECARYLAELIQSHDSLQLVAAPQLSIVNFRYVARDLNGAESNAELTDNINHQIQQQIEEEGQFMMSPTQLEGRTMLRTCIVNHGTRHFHIEGLVERILLLGDRFVGEG